MCLASRFLLLPCDAMLPRKPVAALLSFCLKREKPKWKHRQMRANTAMFSAELVQVLRAAPARASLHLLQSNVVGMAFISFLPLCKSNRLVLHSLNLINLVLSQQEKKAPPCLSFSVRFRKLLLLLSDDVRQKKQFQFVHVHFDTGTEFWR